MTVETQVYESDLVDLIKDYLSEMDYHRRCIRDVEERLKTLMKNHMVIVSL